MADPFQMSVFVNVDLGQKSFHVDPAENDYQETIRDWFTSLQKIGSKT